MRHDDDTTPSSLLQHLQAAVLAMPMARTLGLRFVQAAPGAITLEMPILDAFCFRPGQLQATAVYALGDFAAVAAAGSLLPPGWANATVDGTVKLFAPARGTCLQARGRAVDAGRVLSICAADVWAVDEAGKETPCATWLGTARNLAPRTPAGT